MNRNIYRNIYKNIYRKHRITFLPRYNKYVKILLDEHIKILFNNRFDLFGRNLFSKQHKQM